MKQREEWHEVAAAFVLDGYTGPVEPSEDAVAVMLDYLGEGGFIQKGGRRIDRSDVARLAREASGDANIRPPAASYRDRVREQYEAQRKAPLSGPRRTRDGTPFYFDAPEKRTMVSNTPTVAVPKGRTPQGSRVRPDVAKAFAENVLTPAARKAMAEGTNSSGGSLVADEFSDELIRLVDETAVVPSLARNLTMRAEVLVAPRRTSGITVYQVGEGSTITESQPSYDNIQLTARKIAALTRCSVELLEDATNLGQLVMDEMAFAHALAIDQAAFLGDGSATCFGIEGIITKLVNDGSEGVNFQSSTDATLANVTLADLHEVMGMAPSWVHRDNGAKWITTPKCWHECFIRLAATQADPSWFCNMTRGSESFFGTPVVLVNPDAFPSIAMTNTIALFGDIGLGTTYGDRLSLEIAYSTDRWFESAQVGWRGMMRWDFVGHDVTVGTSNAVGCVTALRLG